MTEHDVWNWWGRMCWSREDAGLARRWWWWKLSNGYIQSHYSNCSASPTIRRIKNHTAKDTLSSSHRHMKQQSITIVANLIIHSSHSTPVWRKPPENKLNMIMYIKGQTCSWRRKSIPSPWQWLIWRKALVFGVPIKVTMACWPDRHMFSLTFWEKPYMTIWCHLPLWSTYAINPLIQIYLSNEPSTEEVSELFR